ncbi:glycoside hydrolase family 18 protein [Amanita thiersii Skay4041]|uniref:Glycoside hydrolase family 18 protein n=1 Tax=Amanita thiersii Skay4041 TaxID=703135 RepID=A0A2A9NR23_9AGAR|nr:glycoside hydrolase family 18 protein [Amanita thiersii Skay4041]
MFFKRFLSVTFGLLLAQSALSVPVNDSQPLEFDGLGVKARELLARATPAAPHFVVYTDAWDGSSAPPSTSAVKVLPNSSYRALSFLLLEGAWDKAYSWTTLTATERASIKSQYAAAGIKLIVSAFGATDVPTTSGADPVATANSFAAWVKQYSLDGIDVDYEDFGAFNAGNGNAEVWLISFTQALRAQLPQGQYILTHAPVAPWFTPNRWGGGGYLAVHNAVGSLIDWYNVQFYNQGVSEYTTCNNLLFTSSSTWPKSSVLEIGASGVPLSKIVIGKPASTGDASNGYMDPSTLASCLQQAKSRGWSKWCHLWTMRMC